MVKAAGGKTAPSRLRSKSRSTQRQLMAWKPASHSKGHAAPVLGASAVTRPLACAAQSAGALSTARALASKRKNTACAGPCCNTT